MKRFLMATVLLIALLLMSIPLSATAQDDGTKPPPYTTGVFPRAMAFDGQRVWVANWADNSITVLNAADGEHVRTLEGQNVVGNQPVALAWDGTHMWVANYLDNTVYRLNVNGELETPFGANEGINRPIALLFDGAHMWIVNQGTGARPGTVTKIVAQDVTLLGNYEVGYYPTAITIDADQVFVANGGDDTVTVLNADTGQRRGQVRVNSFPISMVFDGRYVWVSHYDNTISLIRNTSLTVEESITLEELPERTINLLYAFERVWVTSADDGSIANLKAVDGTLVNTIPTGQFPATLVATNSEIWVANWLDYKIYPVNADEAGVFGGTENDRATIEANVGVWLASPVPSSTPTPTEIPICNTEMPPRLAVGMRGQVDFEGDPSPLRMRNTPASTSDDDIIASYPPGTQFEVLDGPRCIDGNSWYQVELTDGTIGWFIEALGDDYTIEPLQ